MFASKLNSITVSPWIATDCLQNYNKYLNVSTGAQTLIVKITKTIAKALENLNEQKQKFSLIKIKQNNNKKMLNYNLNKSTVHHISKKTGPCTKWHHNK